MPTDEPTQKRLLIFVIAYYAESTLKRVLERIPAEIFQSYKCEVLIVDDASEDRTYQVGHEYQQSHPQIPMTVLRNRYNQGYGGNQKVGYSYALAEGFDYVAMVHGDGQYAPEELPRLMAPLREGRADVVFGSRMLEEGAARQGGMPLYKFLGNKVLSYLQNRLLGARLSEFHSGYRIYSTRALRQIRFRLNSNDFHFDTEIIIQLLNGGFRIVEMPIPTYYGAEICRVNGLKYAADVLLVTAQNVAHRAGLLYQRRFDANTQDNTHYDLKLGYASSHSYALEAVPPGAAVLDIGAGPGGLALELQRKGCQVAVVDQYKPIFESPGVPVVVQDLDERLRLDVRPYHFLLLLDVIEHLKSPERFLADLRAQLDDDPRTLVLTTPNIAFAVQRLMLLLGQFNYGKSGILDSTHTRLFTFRGLLRLLRDEGFQIKEVRGVPAPFPKVLGDGLLGRAAIRANLALIKLSKTLFSYQIYVRAETTPDVDHVLRQARRHSAQLSASLAQTRATGPG